MLPLSVFKDDPSLGDDGDYSKKHEHQRELSRSGGLGSQAHRYFDQAACIGSLAGDQPSEEEMYDDEQRNARSDPFNETGGGQDDEVEGEEEEEARRRSSSNNGVSAAEEKAQVVGSLKMDEAAVVLVELRLRGDYDDVLAAMSPGEAVSQSAEKISQGVVLHQSISGREGIEGSDLPHTFKSFKNYYDLPL